MQRLTAFAATAFLAFHLASPAIPASASAEWFQWRGPNRDGKSPDTGLLKEWPAGGPPLAWKAAGLGSGYSSVSVSGSRLFTMGDKAESSYVLALNRADGKPLWSTQVGKAGAPGWGGFGGPRCTPTVDGNLIYAVDQWGDMICVEAATGKEQWRKNYAKDFGAGLPEWGFSESPLVDGDKVVLFPGGAAGAMVALNKKTGAMIWKSTDFKDGAQYSSITVVEIGGVRQYLQLTMDNLAGIAASDGKLLWKAKRKGATAVIPTPIYADNHVYVTSGYGIGCNLFKIASSGSAFTAEQVYANKNMIDHHGGVVMVGDYLYGHSDPNGWVCQNFKTGEMAWNEKGKLGKGTLSFADGQLICRAEDGQGTIVMIEATPAGYKEKGRFDPPDRSSKNSWPHLTISGGRLYVRDQDVLLCYDLKAK
jgi:hypothetical protein